MQATLFTVDSQITLNLVIACFTVAAVAVAITLWAVWTFQTKVDAKTAEERLDGELRTTGERLDGELKEARTKFEKEIKDIHDHLNKARSDIRDDIKTLWNDLAAHKQDFSAMSRDVSYIRGLLEPRPPKA